MAFLIKGDDAITPSNFVHNLSTNPNANAQGKGPYLMALEFWCDIPDVTAGAWEFYVEYDDPTGATVRLGQELGIVNFVSLTALPAYKVVPLSPVSRLSTTSNWRIVANLIGSAGVSKVSWRVWLFPSTSYEVLGY